MAFVVADRVAETSTTTGTGTYSLAGVASGFGAVRTFVAGVGSTNTTFYCAYDDTGWEVGIGTVTDGTPDTLARTQVLASSNSNNAVNWGAGTRTIIGTLPAAGLDNANFRAAIGLGTANSPQFTGIELGHASDTTLARSAAGVVTIEGVEVVTLSRAQTLTNKTLTDPAITGAITEDIFTISDGAGFEIDPSNGSIQFVTLGADRTPAATNFQNGESVTLRINDGTARSINWSTVGVVWKDGTAPTLATSGYTEVHLEKAGNVIRGVHVGDFAS